MLTTDLDMMEIEADYHVVPVNCCPGVMGAGVARIFRDLFPGLQAIHRAACNEGSLAIGRVRIVNAIQCRHGSNRRNPHIKNIVLLPTKDDWRHPSRAEWVTSGLDAFSDWLHQSSTELAKWCQSKETTIVMPALGCGLGGLQYQFVVGLVEQWNRDMLPDQVRVTMCNPRGTNK